MLLYAGSKLDLKSLLEDLKDVTDWFRLGVWLGIDHAILTTIEKNHKNDSERCKMEMLELWLKKHDASRSEMIVALEGIDHRNLAKQLQKKYNIPQTGTYTSILFSMLAVCILTKINQSQIIKGVARIFGRLVILIF